MTEPELDQLYSRVFATPDGKRVLDHLAEMSPEGWAVRVDVVTRLDRARRRWATGHPSDEARAAALRSLSAQGDTVRRLLAG